MSVGHSKMWRYSMKPARFFFLDARAGVALLVAMLHISTITFSIAGIVIAVFWYLERIGITFPAALRALRAHCAGRFRPPRAPHKMRMKVDLDYRPQKEPPLFYRRAAYLEAIRSGKDAKAMRKLYNISDVDLKAIRETQVTAFRSMLKKGFSTEEAANVQGLTKAEAEEILRNSADTV
jgi:hypothetical protein